MSFFSHAYWLFTVLLGIVLFWRAFENKFSGIMFDRRGVIYAACVIVASAASTYVMSLGFSGLVLFYLLLLMMAGIQVLCAMTIVLLLTVAMAPIATVAVMFWPARAKPFIRRHLSA